MNYFDFASFVETCVVVGEHPNFHALQWGDRRETRLTLECAFRNSAVIRLQHYQHDGKNRHLSVKAKTHTSKDFCADAM